MPFEKDNQAALKHGAFAADVVDSETVERIFPDPTVAERYPVAALALADTFTRWAKLSEHINQVGVDQVAPTTLTYHQSLLRQLLALIGKFGLDPASDAALKRAQAEAISTTWDLEGLAAEGRAALAGRVPPAAAPVGLEPGWPPKPGRSKHGYRRSKTGRTDEEP